nr:adenosine receptor A2b-like [Lytechinus pictus]
MDRTVFNSVLFGINGLGIALNGATVIAIIAVKELRTTQNIFTCNIALSDMAAALISLIITILNVSFIEQPVVISAFLSVAYTSAILSTLAVAFHRFIVIKLDPFNNRRLVTGSRCIITCIVFWLMNSAIFVTIHYNILENSLLGFITPIVILGCHIASAFCYVVIYFAVAASARRAGISAQRAKQNARILITFALVVGTNILCWAPGCIYIIILYTQPRSSWGKLGAILIQVLRWWLFSANSIVNPIIYWARLSDFRNFLSKRCCSKPRSGEGQHVNAGSDEKGSNTKSTVATVSQQMA